METSEKNAALKESTELLQQLIWAGASVKVWADKQFTTLLTIKEADGALAITTMRHGEPVQRLTTATTETAFTVTLPRPRVQEEEAPHEEPHGD